MLIRVHTYISPTLEDKMDHHQWITKVSILIENQSYTIKTRYESSYYQLINRNLSQNKQQIIVTFQENFVSKEYSKNFETTRKSTN